MTLTLRCVTLAPMAIASNLESNFWNQTYRDIFEKIFWKKRLKNKKDGLIAPLSLWRPTSLDPSPAMHPRHTFLPASSHATSSMPPWPAPRCFDGRTPSPASTPSLGCEPVHFLLQCSLVQDKDQLWQTVWVCSIGTPPRSCIDLVWGTVWVGGPGIDMARESCLGGVLVWCRIRSATGSWTLCFAKTPS
jgi:hypothetical protein